MLLEYLGEVSIVQVFFSKINHFKNYTNKPRFNIFPQSLDLHTDYTQSLGDPVIS